MSFGVFANDEELLQDYSRGRVNNLNQLSTAIFQANFEVGWWSEEEVNGLERRNPGGKYTKETATLIASKIALCHSELSEALEGMRKGLMDDHLPDRPMVEVELADTIIRILDLCGFLGLDIGGAVTAKFNYNKQRADHKLANREAAGGKTI
jgi:NTP pyrophosphatase (non-canonical NTP hydrolase)